MGLSESEKAVTRRLLRHSPRIGEHWGIRCPGVKGRMGKCEVIIPKVKGIRRQQTFCDDCALLWDNFK